MGNKDPYQDKVLRRYSIVNSDRWSASGLYPSMTTIMTRCVSVLSMVIEYFYIFFSIFIICFCESAVDILLLLKASHVFKFCVTPKGYSILI